MRKQGGQIIRIGDYWYVRWWERRNVDGTIQRKRVSHQIGCLTTRSRRPPEEIKGEAERFMATVNRGQIPAENILTIADFVESVYLPWIEQHQRPSTLKGYRQVWRQHLKATQHKSGQPNCGKTWLKNTRTYHVNKAGSITSRRAVL